MDRGGNRRAGGRLVAACAVILGVLAMQTLGVHCAPASHAAGSAVSHAHASAAVQVATHAQEAAPDSVVVLCAQMLLGAAGAALLLLRLRRSASPWAVLAPVRAAGVGARTAVIGGGPPYVWEFSVLRR